MTRLSDKYIAGFLDADGWISVNLTIGKDHKTRSMFLSKLTLGFSQKKEQDKVLYMIQEAVGGVIMENEINGSFYCKLVLQGSKARDALNRIKKHLVIKRHYANVCLDLVSKPITDINSARQYLREQRKVKSLPLPNFPPRKWLAGYVDGDGSLVVRRVQKSKHLGGHATPILHIAASNWDTEGIEIIQKNFGGTIRQYKENVKFFSIDLVPSKAKELLGYFSKHLITKKEQAEFILGCAEMGHYRDGENIKSALRHLKTQPHRLSESGVSADSFLNNIEDIKKPWSWKHAQCVACGTTEIRHYSQGYCKKCYQGIIRKNQRCAA